MNSDLSRRQLLKFGGSMLISSGLLGLIGCGKVNNEEPIAGDDTLISPRNDNICLTMPKETAGPYAAHYGTERNILLYNSVQRSDIRQSLNVIGYPGTAIADGIPLTINLHIVNVDTACKPLEGYVIYLWHCDREGHYSMYGAKRSETYLRGVQTSNADGLVTFQSIFPGCYSDRITHINFEIYPHINGAFDGDNAIFASQFTFQQSVLNNVYSTAGYEKSRAHLSKISIESDKIFKDGAQLQTAFVHGDNSGYEAELEVALKI